MMKPMPGWLTLITLASLVLCMGAQNIGQSITQPQNPTPKSDVKCPEPYLNIWGQCLFISKSMNLNFESSKKFCRGMGGDLAQLTHPQVLRVMLIEDFLPAFRYKSERDGYGRRQFENLYYAVGATFNERKSSWIWLKSGIEVDEDDVADIEISADAPYGQSQPSGDAPYCLYLHPNTGLTPFIAGKCNHIYKFVCELTN